MAGKILFDSAQAASIKTVSGWVSSRGHFWGTDERMARYDGSTHRICQRNPEHGEHETNGWCTICYEEEKASRLAAMPWRDYDGTPVVVFGEEEYFFKADDLRAWLVDNDVKPQDARLVFCEPLRLSSIEPDHWADDLPEDGDLPAEVQDALDALNKAIANAGPSAWIEGGVRVRLPAGFLESTEFSND